MYVAKNGLLREAPSRLRAAVHGPSDAAALLWPRVLDTRREHFLALYLDGRHRLIGEPYLVSLGTATASLVHPSEVFAPALRLPGPPCCALILGHNHPSGEPTPSREDRQLATRLRQAGELLGLPLLDFLTLGAGDCYVSLAETWEAKP